MSRQNRACANRTRPLFYSCIISTLTNRVLTGKALNQRYCESYACYSGLPFGPFHSFSYHLTNIQPKERGSRTYDLIRKYDSLIFIHYFQQERSYCTESIALPISFLLYLLAKEIHSVAAYALARAPFKSSPTATTPRTRPPLVTTLPSANLVPAWNT